MSRESSFVSDARAVALLADLVAQVRELREDLRSGLELLDETSKRRLAVNDATKEPDRLLTQREVADLLRVNVRTLRELQHAGEAPPAIKVASRYRWSRRVVEAWIDERAAP